MTPPLPIAVKIAMGDNSHVVLDVPVIDSRDSFAVLLEKLAT